MGRANQASQQATAVAYAPSATPARALPRNGNGSAGAASNGPSIPPAREDASILAGVSGTAAAVRRVPGFRVIENRYPAGLRLSSHFHNHAFLSYLIDGSYTESYANSPGVTCAPGTVRYLPPGMTHGNIFDAGSHCLLVEVDHDSLKRVGEHTLKLERPAEIQGIASGWLAQRLYHEFRRGDELALVSLEGVLLELLADTARHAGSTRPTGRIPSWLRVARECLEANFLEPLSLGEIAGIAGVHRGHLSREFRRHFSTSVGEFVRCKRIEYARDMVSGTDIPLAEIAVICGFADQSHFSANFRRQVGLTPARFRQKARSR